ncbi:TPA: hypothetical protein ACKPZB_001443 [Serratia marcescens]
MAKRKSNRAARQLFGMRRWISNRMLFSGEKSFLTYWRLEQVMAALALVGVKYERRGDACRAAMMAQPVSSGYKFVPVEPTEDMIAAAMNCDDVSFNADETFCVNFGNIYAAMLAAAPESGNDHDTRR